MVLPGRLKVLTCDFRLRNQPLVYLSVWERLPVNVVV